MGIPYEGQPTPSFEDYASIVREAVGDLGLRRCSNPVASSWATRTFAYPCPLRQEGRRLRNR